MEDDRLADVLEELSEAEQLRLDRGPRPRSARLGPRGDGVRRRRRPPGRDVRRAAHPGPGRHGLRRRRRDAPAPGLRRGHRRRPHDARGHHPRSDRHRRRGAGPHPRPRLAGVRSPPRSSSPSRRFVAPTGHVPRRRRTSNACCGSRRPRRCATASSPSRVSRPTPPSGRWPSGSPPTTCSPSRSATRHGRLLGAITVDDVLDRALPAGWRQRRRAAAHAAVVRRREDLSTPRRSRRLDLGIHYDPDAFGEFSETIARTLRHGPLPRHPDDRRGRLDRPQRRRRGVSGGTRTRSSSSTWCSRRRRPTPRR